MPKVYCLLNHELTEKQIAELKMEFNCEEIVYPTEDVKNIWSQISTSKILDKEIISKITTWLQTAKKDDVLIVQGEFGSTFMIVDYALKNGLIPVHAVTKRIAKETREGEIVHRAYVFEHVCFRKYEYFRK